MKKLFLIILTCILLFVFSTEVKADRGDLIYEVEKVTLNDSSITISGYAFIHRTNNYVTVFKRDENGRETSNIVKSNGGQKVRIRISNRSGSKTLDFDHDCENDGYNFYYQMYAIGGIEYSVKNYNDASKNTCNGEGTKCYYEDIGFSIEIEINEILETFSYDEEIWFQIAATNNDYGKWTDYKEMKISNITGSSDSIEVVSGNPNGKVKFTAESAQFQKINDQIKYKYNNTSYYANTGSDYHIFKLNESDYKNGFLKGKNICYKETCFLKDTYSPGKYAVCVNLNTGADACSSINSNGYCTKCNVGSSGKDGVQLVAVYGSWIEFEGSGRLIIRIRNRGCDVNPPDSSPLSCNNSKTLESTCNELTISTSKGNAKVKIEQKGTISSVLTPDKIYAGGGFNFGVMYYNTIKWDYVGTAATGELHRLVKGIMEDKIKDYNTYRDSLNITQLKIGGVTYDSSFLEKKCTTSSNFKNYFKNELTVSCVFTFPESTLNYNGNVTYSSASDKININNKYYTPMDYSGIYKLDARIVGMNRITDSAAKNDSKEDPIPWTGTWEKTFTDCEINLYSLLINSNGKNNFIYRPIDLDNPFPNRNAGINWFDWYSVTRNKERIANTYSDLDDWQYKAILNNNAISEIKNYNKSHNYLKWDSIDEDGDSSFINDKDYIDRMGGN